MVIVLGEDIAGGMGAQGAQDAWGDVLGVSKGLLPEFGRDRIFDTPISESAFIGAAAGAAVTGMRPIAQVMFVDFFGVCGDQIINQMAKFRYMFGGKATTPVVIRTLFGAGVRAASQHSQCLYPIFTHIPGLKVVIPSIALRGEGTDDPVDPRRRPGDLLRAQGDVRRRRRKCRTSPTRSRSARRTWCAKALTRRSSRLGRMVQFAEQAADGAARRRAFTAPWSIRAPPRRWTRRRSWRACARPGG